MTISFTFPKEKQTNVNCLPSLLTNYILKKYRKIIR